MRTRSLQTPNGRHPTRGIQSVWSLSRFTPLTRARPWRLPRRRRRACESGDGLRAAAATQEPAEEPRMWSTRQAVNGTHESRITLVKDSPPPLAPAPRFAACLGAPGGWLCVRLIRCTNAAPIAHDGQVSQVVAAQCVCAVASQLGSTARSGVVRGDSSGGAEWDHSQTRHAPDQRSRIQW